MEIRTAQNTNDYTGTLATNALASPSAVSWGAIFAGGTAAAALSLILVLLGAGLGLSSVSPWSNDGITGKTFGISTIIWITFTSLVASAIGGYIAGRLRTRWVNTAHVDEIHFRDTAHGFLAWAIATLATATLMTSVISNIISGGVQVGAKVAGGAVSTVAAGAATAGAGAMAKPGTAEDLSNMSTKTLNYFTDSLFRREATVSTPATTPPGDAPAPHTDAAKAEVAEIFVNAIAAGSLPAEDARYTAQVVSQQTGLSQADAEKRVTDTFNAVQNKLREAETAARTAADEARKASAYGTLWLFISLLIGAFIASWMAVRGGRQRDL